MKIYLANPLGFSELHKYGLDYLIGVLRERVDVHEPFGETPSHVLKLLKEYENNPIALAAVNRDIGKMNWEAIDECDIVLAVLDGMGVDSGTAAEMGYAYAKGKQVYGLDTDFRMRGDNKGDRINLQVMSTIRESGGLLFTSLDELISWLSFVTD